MLQHAGRLTKYHQCYYLCGTKADLLIALCFECVGARLLLWIQCQVTSAGITSLWDGAGRR